MAIAGLQGTGDFVSGERPENWRQGILMRFPNGHTPITGLTSAMKKKVTDDPKFHTWERELSEQRIRITGTTDITATATTITVAAASGGQGGALQVRKGTMLYVESTGEIMRVGADPSSDTSITVVRNWVGDKVNGTVINLDTASVNPNLLVIGTAYEEGADRPNSTRYRPTEIFNYTQIFRNSLRATRTAMKTHLRTVDEVQDAKTQALLYHGIDMEWAFLLGSRSESVGPDGEMIRTTDGILAQLTARAPANIADAVTIAGSAQLSLDQFETLLLEMFRWGSNEKMAFCGNRAMMAIQKFVRKNATYDISPVTREFGMNVRRFFSTQGTLVLKNHPLFNQIRQGTANLSGTYQSFDSWMFVLDMANLTYRPLVDSDTKYLPNRQGNGIDGLESEYLTECGLELNHAQTHFVLKNLVTGVADA